MNCFRCGATIADAARFCANCGTLVVDPHGATVVLETEDPEALFRQVRMVLAGEYEVESELARGGMGVIFKATEVALRRSVALKVLPPELGVSVKAAERFKREARMVAELDHPNIIPVYRVGQLGGIFFIAMKFIEGRSLGLILDTQGALPVPVALQVLRGATRALAYAHERHIVHRDIKGANILVGQDGRVMVSDFGVALRASDVNLTADGAVIGTPAFMSPEQCAGAVVGPQGDQYSLGIVGFQMLAGEAPFEASSVLAVVQHQYFTPPPDLRGVRADAPEPLLAIISRLVAKDPAHRYTNTSDLVTALETLPFHTEDQRVAKDILRRLARGYHVPIVETGQLPPLPDARDSRAAASVSNPWMRLRPPSRLIVTLGLGAVLLLSGGWFALQATRSRTPTASPAAPTSAAPPPVAAVPSPPLSRVAANRPRPAASGPPGRVRLRTEPADAVIYIDDRQVGVGTVFDLEVPSGRRRLRIKAAGSATFDTTFQVVAGNTTRLGLITLRDLP